MDESSKLVVLSFEGQKAAAAVYEQFEQMEKEKLIQIEDAVILEREANDATISAAPYPTAGQGGSVAHATPPDGEVNVVQTHGKKGKYAAKGGGIGLLAGWLLGGPIGGLAVGAGIGAITGAIKDFGISDDNIEAIKARLQPNTSALLVLGTVQDRDAFLARVKSYDADVLLTSLSPEVEKQLREHLRG